MRLTKKSPDFRDVALSLHQLLLRPSSIVHHLKCGWQLRSHAFGVYESDVGRLLNRSRREVRSECTALWSKVDWFMRDRWSVVYAARCALDSGPLATRVPGIKRTGRRFQAAPWLGSGAAVEDAQSSTEVARGLGLLRTFNTQWHLFLPELAGIMQGSQSLSEKVDALRSMPELYSRFGEYEKNVQLLAKKHGLMSWACSLVISLHASSIGRVHLHDYIGPMMSHNVNASDPRRVVDFDASD